ncbi:CoA-disulfide reductase [Ignatzschineria sp. LJL83]
MHYLILGANAAGLSAAVRILKSDPDASITILEKNDVVSFGACGIPYYISGEFTEIERMTARPFEDFIQMGIDIKLFHEAIDLDENLKKVTAKNIKNQTETPFFYDKLLITTGASPIIPPIKGIHSNNVYTMHSKYDAITIAKEMETAENIIVIGGGFIGVEAAEAFKEKKKNVTLIEYSKRILEKIFDEEITTLLEEELYRNGVNLNVNERVSEIIDNDDNTSTVITDHGEYSADLILLATGFKPNTDFLKNSAIQLSPQNAIIIDELCQTNVADIYAAGDCATVKHRISGDQYLPLATTANKLGRLVGSTITGDSKEFIGTLGSSGIRVFNLEAGRTGISEKDAQELGIHYNTVFIKDKNHSDYVPSQSDMWVKLIYNQDNKVLLGAQVCGSYLGGAVHRVDALAVAIYSQLTVEELGFMDFIYAPPFARTWNILNIAGNVAK